MMKWLLDLIGSGVVKAMGESILVPILRTLEKKTDAETERQKLIVGAAIETGRVQAENFRLMWGWWGTRWLMLLAAIPPCIHSGAVYLDSTFKFGWAIAKAPGPYEGMEIQIVLGACGIQAATTLVGGLVSWLRK